MWSLFCHELRIQFRQRADLVSPLCFFLVVIALFPLGLGPAPERLARLAPEVVWIAAMLASMLALDHLFREDHASGTLEQYLLLPVPLPAVVLVKMAAHWVANGLPLVLLSPLAALMLGTSVQAGATMAATLLLGTPALVLLGAPLVALILRVKRGGGLLSVLVLPLTAPLLIFATAAIDAAATGLPVEGYLAILGAMLAGSATISPFITAAALRISLQ